MKLVSFSRSGVRAACSMNPVGQIIFNMLDNFAPQENNLIANKRRIYISAPEPVMALTFPEILRFHVVFTACFSRGFGPPG
jgi:hypothetical protein